MWRVWLMTLMLIISFPSLAVAAKSVSPTIADASGYQKVWGDEFNGSQLNLKKWEPQDPFGVVRNHELQAYSRDAVAVKGGFLTITATQD